MAEEIYTQVNGLITIPVNVIPPGLPMTLDELTAMINQAKEAAEAANREVTKFTHTISSLPTQKSALAYNGKAQSPTWDGYDTDAMTISGTQSGTNVGSYSVTFTPKDGYQWWDGTKTGKAVQWTIGKAKITAVPSQNGTLTYNGTTNTNGTAQTPNWNNYDSTQLTLSVTAQVNAGTYQATFTPTSNYCWSDGSTTAKTVNWTIGKKSLTKTTAAATAFTYSGSGQIPTWTNYNSNQITIGGHSAAQTNVGNYTTTFTPMSNFQWADGYVTAISISWSISRAKITTIPSQNGTLTYNGTTNTNGTAQTPSWNNYNSSQLTLSVTAQTNAGTYQATFTPTSNYSWSDGSTTAKTVNWTIGKKGIAKPTASATSFTYSGSGQIPTWTNYNSSQMTIGGTTAAQINAKSYSTTFTLMSNFQWSDGTTAAVTITWTINKAAGSLTLNKSSVSLIGSVTTDTVTVTRTGDGAISVTTSAAGVATAAVNGTTVTITAVATGSATITVKVAAGTNHNAPADKTIAVTVMKPSATLADNTPEIIKETTKAGQAANYWKVGDKIPIALKGTVGALSLNGTYYAIIIGFNHNSSIEGNNSVHFQFGQDASGTDIAFVDSKYGNTGSDAAFRMNTGGNVITGGWKSSYMLTTICPQFLATMPAAWQNVIVACTKYSDNTGGGSDNASYVTSTSDKIWLLSEFELHGAKTYSNSAEKNYQKQYDYYVNGNKKIKYKHNDTGFTSAWWLRSVRAQSTSYFCIFNSRGEAYYSSPDISYGFAPGFKVA